MNAQKHSEYTMLTLLKLIVKVIIYDEAVLVNLSVLWAYKVCMILADSEMLMWWVKLILTLVTMVPLAIYNWIKLMDKLRNRTQEDEE